MFEIVENKFELGKESIYPFAAELHYYRVDKRYWSLCFERIKRAGIRLITTSAPWSLHQNKNRELDFVGLDDPRKDLTVFLELARELGFKIILRPGPYIGADWRNGGIPEFVTSDVSSLARDSAGEVIKLTGAPGFKGGYLASYMSPAFQNSVKHYYKAFVDATRNYIHPRGPIIAIEFDSAPSYGGLFAPAAADYNEQMLQREFPPFLMDLYDSIKDLNSCYKTKYDDFSDVEPPREFDGADEKSLPRIFDWFRFKERMLGRYLEEQKVIFDGYTVHPKIICTTAFGPKHLAPFYNFIDSESGVLPGGAVSYDESYPDLARRGRYLRGLGGFPWGSAFPTGRASEDPKIGEELRPITDGERRFLLASALGSGYKGVNFRMFVDHERWYGGALRVDGSVTSGYEFTRGIADSAENMELAEMQPDVQVAVVGNRLYQWFAELPDPKSFACVRRLVNESLPGVCRDLARLKIDYNVCESGSISTLGSYKLVIIPSAEFMAEAEQQAIIDLSKAGTPVALFGVMPRFDEHFNDCTLLSAYLKTKTTTVDAVKEIKTKTNSFAAYTYCSLKTTDSRAKKVATVDRSVAAITSSKKGSLSFYGFDISTGFDHHKLMFMEETLNECGVSASVYCSDPLVDVVAHASAKKVAVFLMAPPPGELGDRVETQRREIFLRVDLKKLGFKSPNIKMSDLFSPEETPPLKLTLQALADGLPMEIDFPDGKALLIERR